MKTSEINWSALHGARNGSPEDWVYFCQHVRNGNEIPAAKRYRFPFSWQLDGDVTDLRLLARKPPGFKVPLVAPPVGGHMVAIKRGHIMVGCTKVDNYTVRLIAKMLKS